MTTLDAIPDIRFERVTGTIGALVHGVSLDERSPAVAQKLEHALHEHGVLFFEYPEVVSEEQLMGFSELFGELEGPYRLSMKEQRSVGYMDAEFAPLKESRITYFHTDGTPFENPPQAAVLTPVELPEAGGGTMWASMYAAYDDLSSYTQRLLEDLDVVHNTKRLPFLKESPETVHPAVIRDKVTGRKALFVNANYSDRIVGMSERESNAILNMLYDHINTPEYHVRVRWQLGTIAVWEERVTQHRGVADFTGPRKLRRLTFKGDRPSR
jgi:taurine dioxygenase